MSESLPTLNAELVSQIAKTYRGTAFEPRVKLLEALLRDDQATIPELARRIGRAEGTVRNYLGMLRRDGVEGLFPDRHESSSLTYSQRQALQTEAARGSFESLRDAADWVFQQYGQRYSLSGIRRLLNSGGQLTRRLVDDSLIAVSTESRASEGGNVGESRLVRFLNALPPARDRSAWATQVRAALKLFIPGLENAVIFLNSGSRLEPTAIASSITTHLELEKEQGETFQFEIVRRTRSSNYTEAGDRIMEGKGYRLSDYQPPLLFEGMIGEHDLVGAIVLYFRKGLPDAFTEAERIVEKLRPFLTFLLSDGVAKGFMDKPQTPSVRSLIVQFAARYGLTERQREVFILYLRGRSADDIATALGIAPKTVQNHISAIHQKTDTASQREIFSMIVDYDGKERPD